MEVDMHRTYTQAFEAAYDLACQCFDEAAEETKETRRAYLLSEAERHLERSEWYADMAAWCTPKDEKRNAA